jgi:ATP-binding cassette subfamily F protein 3
MALQSIISLSGGQKSRVAFALMSFQKYVLLLMSYLSAYLIICFFVISPNFLVLDEPTNHLDMETIEALGEALNLFQGGIILVSHDERLIQLICKELWLARDHKVTSIAGGYEQYRKLIEKELEF